MIVFARCVAPVSSPPLRDACVEIAGDRIVSVERYSRAARPRLDFEVEDALLIPGLINVHTHLELAAYAGQLAPMPFWEWIGRLVRMRRAAGAREREYSAARDAAWAGLRAGVTTVGDISRRGDAWRALADVPIRKVCFAELLELAEDPPRTPEELEQVLDAVPCGGLLRAGVSPHAPFSVREASIRRAVEIAAERRLPWTLHFLETEQERAFLDGDVAALPEPLGSRAAARGVAPPAGGALGLLASVSRGTGGGLLAHANYLRDEEIPVLAALGHTVVYCPRAHRFFGHRPHPWRRLAAAGVRVVLGTDSPASNEGVSLLDELQFVAREAGARDATCSRAGDAPLLAADLLRRVTVDAAAALGRADELGTIEPGKQADLAAFPLRGSAEDPLEDLVRTAPSATAVWVAGRRVV